MPSRCSWQYLLLSWLLLILAGCQERVMKVPGETDVAIASVSIRAKDPATELAVPHAELFERLGMRKGSLLITPRYYSEFREAEDRRRIESYFQQRGYFDVEVFPAEVSFDAETGHANIVFEVRENKRYGLGTIEIVEPNATPDPLLALQLTAKSHQQHVDLEELRQIRIQLQDGLRVRGFGHANAYSRFYVDREELRVHVRYFIDRGPPTLIASVVIDGNVRVPEDEVLAHSGLVVGERYSEDLREVVVRRLLDTGSFAAAYVRVDTDTKFIAPGSAPDSGGELRDEQVDAEGNLVLRKLPSGVNLTVHVVEASRVTWGVRAGLELDPARADTFIAQKLQLRDVLGPLGHLVIEGRFGYGWLFGTASDDPSGPYGEAAITTEHAVAQGISVRTSARYRGDLFPSAFLHVLQTGPGLRFIFDRGLFLDTDLLAVWHRPEGFGPFTSAERSRLALPSSDPRSASTNDTYGPELSAHFVWDARDNPIEPMRGHLLALYSRLLPGGPIASHRALDLAPEARGFIPLTAAMSLGGRMSTEWILLPDDQGIPLGYRLFGGGSYGFRGFGRQLLSSTVARCFEDYCTEVAVGSQSLFESQLELRFLPPRVPAGAVVFTDLGAASGNENPFFDGISLAAGIGGRLRIWYLPLAIDVSYRILHENAVVPLEDAPFNVFFRIGEAF